MSKAIPKNPESSPETPAKAETLAQPEVAATPVTPAAVETTPVKKTSRAAKTARASTKAAPKAVEKTEAPVKAKPVKEKKVIAKKPKLVRDSFTFPETDYALIATLKQRALTSGKEVKKSEILRAGLVALAALPEKELLVALDGVARLKPGRPNK